MAVNLNDTTPAAPGAGVNVKWQSSGSSASAYIDGAAAVPTSPSDATEFLNGAATPAFAKVKDSDLATTDVTSNNSSSTKHGFAPKAPADSTQFLNGAATPAYAAVKDTDLATTDVTGNNSSSTKHGFAPKAPADSTQFLNGAATPAYAAVKDSDLATTDITTNNVSITKHGFCPKAPNDATKFLDGTGAFSVGVQPLGSPAAGELAVFAGPTGIQPGDLSGDVATSGSAVTTIQPNAVTESKIGLSDVTTDNVSITKHGFAPKAPNDATKFLDGTGAFSTPSAGSLSGSVNESQISLSDVTTDNVSSTAHGFAPKSPADATKFMNGATTPAYAQVKDSDLATSDVTTNNVSITKHGFAPKAPNDATKYLDGTGAYSTPAGTVTPTPVEEEIVSFTGTAGTLAHTPSTSSGYNKVKLYRNGQRLLSGAGNDFTRSGASITLATAAGGSDVFVADYWQ